MTAATDEDGTVTTSSFLLRRTMPVDSWRVRSNLPRGVVADTSTDVRGASETGGAEDESFGAGDPFSFLVSSTMDLGSSRTLPEETLLSPALPALVLAVVVALAVATAAATAVSFLAPTLSSSD